MSQVCPICNNEIDDDATACPHCGFKLLGATQGFAPVKLDDEPSTAAQGAPQAPNPEFKVVRGPQTGISLVLKPGKLTIGRNPKCDIFLNDMTVSRKHAEVETSERGTVIRDLDSFNGVWVNNENVKAHLLQPGDVIQIGAFCLVFQPN